MPGGLLNIISYGQENVFLHGNPTKTFFKTTYVKHTNFGMQKFNIDFAGSRVLRHEMESVFDFKIPRYGDLLMDTQMAVDLPHIWSPIIPPNELPNPATNVPNHQWLPYEFKWIDDLGTQMIKEVEFSIGGQTIQRYSGAYLKCLMERDFSETKKALYNRMTGNIPELNDPGNSGARVNQYPNAYHGSTNSNLVAEPSIRGRTLYVPLGAWFAMSSKSAFPLVSLQYNELNIRITIRPIKELYVIRDPTYVVNGGGEGEPSDEPSSEPSIEMRPLPYIAPRTNEPSHQFHRFLYPPMERNVMATTAYQSTRTDWSANVRLVGTFGFLCKEEVDKFALGDHSYLLREVHETVYHDLVGTKSVELNSLGMNKLWMWAMRRNDVHYRNQWSNYTNWPYDYLPYDIQEGAMDSDQSAPGPGRDYIATTDAANKTYYDDGDTQSGDTQSADTTLTNSSLSGLYITGYETAENVYSILEKVAITFGGKYRENEFNADVYDVIEKYNRTGGNGVPGLYCYNFGLTSDCTDYQPNGALNTSKFNNISIEIQTHVPPMSGEVEFTETCDANGAILATTKTNGWRLMNYAYDMLFFEERYNVLVIKSGNAGLKFAR